MPRPSLKEILNLSDRDRKRELLSFVGRLDGDYEINIEPRLMTRRQRANRYYFAAVVTPLMNFLNEQDVKIWSKDEVHDLIKAKILPLRQIVHPQTGEVLHEVTATTHDMKIPVFHDFVERARAWIHMTFPIETYDPDERDFQEETTAAEPKGAEAA